MIDEELWTAAKVARFLGVTTGWVYAQSRARQLPTINLGRYKRYRRDAIIAWVAQLERESMARTTTGDQFGAIPLAAQRQRRGTT